MRCGDAIVTGEMGANVTAAPEGRPFYVGSGVVVVDFDGWVTAGNQRVNVGGGPVVAFQFDRHVLGLRHSVCGVELARRADLQRRHTINGGDLQEVVDGATGLALQQITQVDAVAFACIEVLDHVVAGVAGLPDEGVGTRAANQGVVARTADQRVVTGAAEQDVIALAAIEDVVATLAEENVIACAAEQRVVAVMGAGHVERGVVLGDELVHVAGGDFADVHAGLLGDERLHGLVALAGDAGEAHQVAEQDVIAVTAADRVGTWQRRFGVTDDRVGQVFRVDVGLRVIVRVVWFQVAEAHTAVDADGVDMRQTVQYREAAVGVVDGGLAGTVAAARQVRQLVGAVALSVNGAQVGGAPATFRRVRLQLRRTVAADGEVVRAVDVRAEGVAGLVVAGFHHIVELHAAVQRRVGLLAALVVGRLAVSDEVREVFRPSVSHGISALEPVGRGFEHVLVVGTAAGRHRVQDCLEGSQRIRIVQVDRHRLVDLGIEVCEEDVHGARVAAHALLQGVEHRRQRVLGRADRRRAHAARTVDHEGDVVVGARHHGQAADVGDHDVVAVGAGDGVTGCRGGDRVVRRRVNGNRDLRRGDGRTAQRLGGSRGNGQVELAVEVGRRGDGQRAEVPAGDVGFAGGRSGGEGVTGAIGVGQCSIDRGQVNVGAFEAFVEFVAVVVAFAIGAVQVGNRHASRRQIRHAGVQRHAGTAQVDGGAAIDRQVDVIAARAVLVVVVDVQGVVAAGGRGERAAQLTASAPRGGRDVFAADGHQQAVIAGTGEGVGFAGFEVDQAEGFRRRTGGHAAVGLHVSDVADGVWRTGGIDDRFERGGRCAAAIGTEARQAGPDFLDQSGGFDAVVRNVQGRCIGDRGDVDFHRAGVAQQLAVSWLELDLRVVRLIVAQASATVAVSAGFIGIRGEAQLASVDVSFGDGLVDGDVGPGRAVQVLQLAVARQAGDFHTQARGR